MAIDATAETFDKDVQGSMTIVDFWAPWCGPCKMMEPAMQNLEKQYGDKIKFVRMNVDGNQEIAQRFFAATCSKTHHPDRHRASLRLQGNFPAFAISLSRESSIRLA